MKKDISDLKKLVVEIIQHPESMGHVIQSNAQLVTKLYQDVQPLDNDIVQPAINLQPVTVSPTPQPQYHPINFAEEVEESLSLNDQEADLIKKALKKHKGKRKYAASELGISERTLYRKIKELNL
ncbi:Bacterial regulatory protein, Fis family [compost metagenome]